MIDITPFTVEKLRKPWTQEIFQECYFLVGKMPISSEKTKLGAATVITFWFGLPWSLLCADWWLDNKHWVQRRFFGGFLLENYNKELLRSGFIYPVREGTSLFCLYGYVQLNRVWFTGSWVLNRSYNFTIKQLERSGIEGLTPSPSLLGI